MVPVSNVDYRSALSERTLPCGFMGGQARVVCDVKINWEKQDEN